MVLFAINQITKLVANITNLRYTLNEDCKKLQEKIHYVKKIGIYIPRDILSQIIFTQLYYGHRLCHLLLATENIGIARMTNDEILKMMCQPDPILFISS